MSNTTATEFERLFRVSDVGWFFKQDPEGITTRVLQEMEEIHKVLHDRLLVPIRTPLVDQIFTSPQGYKPLVQSFASPMSAEIRAMIYCVLNGAEIQTLEYRFKRKSSSFLKIGLEMPSGETVEFKSRNFWDFEAIKHFGMLQADGKPIIDGYFSFRYS